jgi:hypothetical protein
MIKKTTYWITILTVALGLFATSCIHDNVINEMEEEVEVAAPSAEGKRFKVTMGLQADDLNKVQLRSGGVETLDGVTSLRLLVFDENQKFLYSEDAVLGNTTTNVPTANESYLPDAQKGNISEIKQFTVSLIKSSQKRYIHFIANHKWVGFTQDYFAVGKSAGEMLTDPKFTTTLPGLDGTNPVDAFDPMWSVVEVPALDENTFNGKVVKLLRNYAKISVAYNAGTQDPNEGSFVLQGFAVGNVMKTGSIVPFRTENYLYYFDFPPNTPTVPANAEIIDASEIEPNFFIPSSQSFNLFEKGTDEGKIAFVLIKGERTNRNGTSLGVRYYKVDLITRKAIDQNDPNKVISAYFPILRNRHYQVNIASVNSDGFATIADAIQAPAGNNIFSSVELKDFEHVSDGQKSLVVSPIQQVLVTPGTYSFSTNYMSGTTDLRNYLRYYPTWDTATDNYLGALTGTPDGFTVEVKAIPPDAVLDYSVEVVALRYSGTPATPVDGISGATTPILRQVRLTLRPPFEFNAVLHPKETGTNYRTLEFDVPKAIPSTLVPFNVLIETSEMTPVNAGEDNKVILVYKDGKTYYQYTVTQADYTAGKAQIPFKMNTSDGETTKPIHLTSGFYNKQTLLAEAIEYTTTDLILKYARPDGATPMVPLTSVFTFTFDGVDYTTEELFTAYNMTFTTGGSDGYFKMSAPNSFISANGNENFTITTEVLKTSSYGHVKYTVSSTKTLNEWASTGNTNTATLEPQAIEITGRIRARTYYNQGYYQTTLNLEYLYLYGFNPQVNITSFINISPRQYYQDGWYGYPYTLTLNRDTANFPGVGFPNNSLYFWYNGDWRDYKDWNGLESSTDFLLTI